MPELRSRTVTHGRNMAGARALMRASGVPGADIGRKPIKTESVASADLERLVARLAGLEADGPAVIVAISVSGRGFGARIAVEYDAPAAGAPVFCGLSLSMPICGTFRGRRTTEWAAARP